jgi:hypothetical protein
MSTTCLSSLPNHHPKLVTGDEDVRVRDYMSDAKLRKAMQPAASSNRPSTPGAPGSSAKDASQELVIAGSQDSSDNGDTVLGDDDAAPAQGGAQGPGQALKFQVSCNGLSQVAMSCHRCINNLKRIRL